MANYTKDSEVNLQSSAQQAEADEQESCLQKMQLRYQLFLQKDQETKALNTQKLDQLGQKLKMSYCSNIQLKDKIIEQYAGKSHQITKLSQKKIESLSKKLQLKEDQLLQVSEEYESVFQDLQNRLVQSVKEKDNLQHRLAMLQNNIYTKKPQQTQRRINQVLTFQELGRRVRGLTSRLSQVQKRIDTKVQFVGKVQRQGKRLQGVSNQLKQMQGCLSTKKVDQNKCPN